MSARCRHEESLHGRCVACGMTWTEQARAKIGGDLWRVDVRGSRGQWEEWARGLTRAEAEAEAAFANDQEPVDVRVSRDVKDAAEL